MKRILLVLILNGSLAVAQENAAAPEIPQPPAPVEAAASPAPAPAPPTATLAVKKKPFYREDTLIGLSYLQWNEKMKLQQGTLSADDKANFEGASFNLERHMAFATWGFAFGASLGSGKASGGGNASLISYQQGNRPWTMYGGYLKIYQKWTGRLYAGLTLPLFFRKVDWPEQSGLVIRSGKNMNLGALVELNLRLNTKWDLYQSLGPFSDEGATLWRLGLAYRL